jgi:hypothetical protein
MGSSVETDSKLRLSHKDHWPNDLDLEAGVALLVGDADQALHIGVIYNSRSGRGVRLCHFVVSAEDYQNGNIADDKMKWTALWRQPAIEPFWLDQVACYCEATSWIFKEKKTFPYGFGMLEISLDLSGGGFGQNPPTATLSCLSFVLAVFEAIEHPLLDSATWYAKSRAAVVKDVALQRKIASNLSGEDRENASTRSIGSHPVLNPKEVLAAACVEDLPAQYNELSKHLTVIDLFLTLARPSLNRKD